MSYESACLIHEYLIQEFSLSSFDAKQMITEYIENLERLYNTAISTINSQPWKDLDRIGHSVKGTSANVGLTKVAEIGKTLQHACSVKDMVSYISVLTELKDAIKILNETKHTL